MSEPSRQRPTAEEYGDYYAGYVGQVPDGDVLETLERQGEEVVELLAGLAESDGARRYAPGKWSVKEVLGHVIDTERIFAVRALAFARGERQSLPGFEQDDYVRTGEFDARPLAGLIEEFAAVRRANVVFFAGLGEEAWGRRGTANNLPFTVRAVAWILAGHAAHHLQVLRKRYLG